MSLRRLKLSTYEVVKPEEEKEEEEEEEDTGRDSSNLRIS